jgi:PKD repeat protein
MKIRIVYTFIFLFISNLFYAQHQNFCGADEMRIEMLKNNPELAKAIAKREQALEQYTAAYTEQVQQKKMSTPATYIIPVVFHVIHNYGVENISDAQLKDGLDIVNKTFRKLRPDTNSIVAAFQPIHADCEIEFRLAQIDPNGNCHSGINRIASSLTSIGDHSVKSLIHWDPTKYLNVYVVENAAGLAGHAIFPSDADSLPLWDGIVLTHSYVGTIGTSTLTRSVAFAHECGHYLNLQHIWGGNNVPGFYYYPCADPFKDCNIDDLVADTPPTIGWQTCNLSGASCLNSVDNVQNVMDYSYCNIMFTQGQKVRMHACLNSTFGGRNNLWQTANLIATGVYSSPAPLCNADFTVNKNVMCNTVANQVVYTNTSYNGNFSSVEWVFPGGTPSVSSAATPTVTYTIPGVYGATLKVKNGSDSLMVTKNNLISVVGNTTASFPFTDDFETTTSLSGIKFFENTFDTINRWQITTNAAYSSTHSIWLDNFNNSMNTKDELYSQMIDITGVATPAIKFKYAFARKDSTNKDQLQVFITKDCNSTWLQRLSTIGAALETVPPVSTPFVPSAANEWKEAIALIPATYQTSTFRFKIVFTSKGGNNIYIDDINLDTHIGINEQQMINELTVFPNPANDELDVLFELKENINARLVVSNVLGQELLVTDKKELNRGLNKQKLQVSNLVPGIYLIKVVDGNKVLGIKKIVKY